MHYMLENQTWTQSTLSTSITIICYKNSAIIEKYTAPKVEPGESPYGLAISIADDVLYLTERKIPQNGTVE